ncbi:MAG: porin family protein [Zoogloea sp.]|nr:porin family protein [Zoogloea sp.]
MKITRILTIAAALSALTAPAFAGDWQFLPIAEKGYAPNFVASVTGGIMDPQHAKSGDAWGLELAMNCGLIQTPTGVVRTKLSVNKFDKGGLNLTTVELNPRWTIPVAKDVTFGIGPGIGWVKADAGNRTVDMFAWQAGADLDYRMGQLNLGLGARWQDTVGKTIATGQQGADNWLVQAKVGIAF